MILRTFSVIFLALSLGLIITATNYNTSNYDFSSGSSVVNLAKLQAQMMILQTGIGFLVTGCLLWGFASVVERMDALNLSQTVKPEGEEDANPTLAIIESDFTVESLAVEPDVDSQVASDFDGEDDFSVTSDAGRRNMAIAIIIAIFAAVVFVILKNEDMI